jgi:exopolysaccharide biosynthesis WecB/TagA/CpsF family protein
MRNGRKIHRLRYGHSHKHMILFQRIASIQAGSLMLVCRGDLSPLAPLIKTRVLLLNTSSVAVWRARRARSLCGDALHLVTGSDLVVPLRQAAAREKRSVFFFGTTFDALRECARRIHASIHGLDIRSVYSPPFGFERDSNECLLAENAIRAAAPEIGFVALGKPKQEIWARDNAGKLGIQAICIGGSPDFIAGKQWRAPPAVRRMGFEWLWRVLTEPRRLGMRYAMMLCWFPDLVVSDLVSARRRGR